MDYSKLYTFASSLSKNALDYQALLRDATHKLEGLVLAAGMAASSNVQVSVEGDKVSYSCTISPIPGQPEFTEEQKAALIASFGQQFGSTGTLSIQ